VVEIEKEPNPIAAIVENGKLTTFAMKILIFEAKFDWDTLNGDGISRSYSDFEVFFYQKLARFEEFGFDAEELMRDVLDYADSGNRSGLLWVKIPEINEINFYSWCCVEDKVEFAYATFEDSSEDEYGSTVSEMALQTQEKLVKSQRTRITKLNENNYPIWKIKMALVLDDQALWDSKVEKPVAGRQSWKEIMFAIEDNQFVHCETLFCGLKAWDALAAQHEKQGIHTKLSTMGLLFQMRYEGGSMDDYCSNIVTTSRKLARLGVKFDDEIIIGILLHGLPDKFQTIIHAWDAVSDNLKLDEVISKLKNMSLGQESQQMALSTADKKCFACGKFGHFKKDCKVPKKVPYQKKKGKGFLKKASWWSKNTAHTAGSRDYGLMSIDTRVVNSWILDSGATRHMCRDEAMLFQIANIKPFKIFVANGKHLLATKVGKTIVQRKTISEVYYVNGLSSNLLSVSQFARNHSIHFSGDRCEVRNQKGEIVLKTFCKNNVYRVTALAATEGVPTVTFRQAHEMLGHVNTNVLKNMINKNQVGWNVIRNKYDSPCFACVQSKLTRTIIPKKSSC